jgi:hypothetical protein
VATAVGTTGDTAGFAASLVPAAVFSLDSGVLYDYSGTGASAGSTYGLSATSGSNVELAYFRNSQQRAAKGQLTTTCSIVSGFLTCTNGRESQFRYCRQGTGAPILALGSPTTTTFSGYTCSTITLKVVPLCIVPPN